jgi:FkbM family methyltransferase
VLKTDGWYFPDREAHLPIWMANPKVRMHLNGRASYQGQKQVAAMGLCKQKRVAIDVGGHVGLWSFNLSHEFDEVHAFEPVAAHRECFLANTLACDNITLHACALGDHEGMVAIRTEPTSSGDSRVDGDGDIPMHTLDSFALSRVDLIKIDTEGHELFVLRGAEETIARCKPVICVEQKKGHAVRYGIGDTDAVPYLQSLGYKVRKEMSGDYLMTCD